MVSDDLKAKIKEHIKVTGMDGSSFKERWKACTIEDEDIKRIACGVLFIDECRSVLDTWSTQNLKKYGIDNVYEFWMKTIQENQDKITDENSAVHLVGVTLQKKLRVSAREFVGMIINPGRKRDNFSDFIKLVFQMYDSDPQAAIQSSYVEVFSGVEELKKKYPELENKLTDEYFRNNKIVIPMGKEDVSIKFEDTKFVRKKWYGGRYDGKPVVGTAFMRGLDIIAKTGEEPYKRYKLTLNDEYCNINTPTGQLVKFYANVSASDKTRLNPASSIQFKPIGDVDINDFSKVLDKMMLKFDDIPEYVKSLESKDRAAAYEVKATWVRVTDMPPTEGSTHMWVSAPKEFSVTDMQNLFDDKGEFKDTSMYVNIPNHIHVNWGEDSKVLVFHSPRYGSSFQDGKWVQDKEKFSMWLNSVYVPTDQVVENTHTVDASDQELDETFETPDDNEAEETEVLNDF